MRQKENEGDHYISRAVITRLPRYYRYLGNLMDEKVERISSAELSRRMNVTASQIRQDLNNFGGFGQQGYGYNVKYLHGEIGKILGLDRSYNMIIVGTGNLGSAIANYVRFEENGFRLVGLFDNDPKKEGQVIRDVPVSRISDLETFLQQNHVDIAALTLPTVGAEKALPILIGNGVKAIWNFAHTDLDVPDDVTVENVHLSDSLVQLSYSIHMRSRREAGEQL